MNFPLNKSTLLTAFFATVLLFNGCSDDDDEGAGPASSPAPFISGFSPQSGDPGTVVIITGSNFSAAVTENAVAFNNAAAEVVEATTTALKVVVPDAATNGKVSVTVAEKKAVSENEFTVAPTSFFRIPGSQADEISPYAIAHDNSGNTYIAGNIKNGSVTFGNSTITAAEYPNGFVAMHNDIDGFVWASQLKNNGSGASLTRSIALDEAGNVYVTGWFNSTVQIGAFSLTSTGEDDVFLAKYTASGEVVWARQAGGSSYEKAYHVAIEPSGDILITGEFRSEEVLFGDQVITAAGTYTEAFVARCDANGNFKNVIQFSGTNSVVGRQVATDAAGNVFVFGDFYGTMDIGGTSLTSAGANDIFMVKYTNAGAVSWAKKTGTSGSDRLNAALVNASGDIYIASMGVTEKFTAAGEAAWKKSFGGLDDCWVFSIALDASENLYSTGYFYGDKNYGTALSSLGSGDVFIARQNTSSGEFIGAQQAGGIGLDDGMAIKVTPSGYVYVCGYFQQTATFGEHTESASGEYEMFLWKFRP